METSEVLVGQLFAIPAGRNPAALAYLEADDVKRLAAMPEDYKMADHWWAMMIDTGKCTGSGNCVKACSVENLSPRVTSALGSSAMSSRVFGLVATLGACYRLRGVPRTIVFSLLAWVSTAGFAAFVIHLSSVSEDAA